jgi:MerR family transcriptional regulator, copper efflux regulator
MLIHQAAKAIGVSADTIRYYERLGLIDQRHVLRQQNGYRVFTAAAVERLRHLSEARQRGLTISDLVHLTAAHDQGRLDRAERQRFLRLKVEAITKQIAILQRMKSKLEASIDEP